MRTPPPLFFVLVACPYTPVVPTYPKTVARPHLVYSVYPYVFPFSALSTYHATSLYAPRRYMNTIKANTNTHGVPITPPFFEGVPSRTCLHCANITCLAYAIQQSGPNQLHFRFALQQAPPQPCTKNGTIMLAELSLSTASASIQPRPQQLGHRRGNGKHL